MPNQNETNECRFILTVSETDCAGWQGKLQLPDGRTLTFHSELELLRAINRAIDSTAE